MRFALLLSLCLGTVAAGGPGTAAAVAQDLQCSGCKAKLKPDAKFCTGCGEKVPTQECASCKKPMKLGAKFCTECGAKVEEKPAPKPPPPAPEKKDPPAAEKKDPPLPPPPPKKDEPARPAQDTDPAKVKETRGQELEKFGVTADQINRAIERGAAYLAAKFAKHDLTQPEDYLIAYALIHTSQYHTNAKLRDKIIAFLKGPAWQKMNTRGYVVGLRALALEATRDPDLKALTRECAEYLIEAQGPQGTWTYGSDVPIESRAQPVKGDESDISVAGGEPLDEEIKGEMLTRKGTCKNPGDGDNSITQFAVLGLHAAAKCGYSVPKEVWKKCHDEMLERKCKDGGWAYHSQSTSYGSMSCAGVCTLALCRYYLGEKEYLTHPALQGGVRWLADNFTVSKNPGSNSWELYYLYSVERVGIFMETEMIGPHRWYPLGAKYLVDTQEKEGHWKQESDHHVGTSFALLFLTRATAPVSGVKRGGKGWLDTHFLNDAQHFMFILDASGSMREEIDGREKFEIAKEVIESIVKKLPEGTHAGLRVYGHRFTALDEKSETDSELVIPPAAISQARFVAQLKALKCKGKTPITHSLNETIGDISRVDSELDLTTILLTDGGESTRGAKPPQAAAKLAAARKGMKVHVVGFDINDDDWKDQLEKTAEAGNGKYFHCLKPADLLQALALVTGGQGDFVLLDKEGKEVAKGKLGDRFELPEGKYRFVSTLGGRKSEKSLWINTEATTHVTVRPPKK